MSHYRECALEINANKFKALEKKFSLGELMKR
jgi:hypothetical protein